jgi:hypothetical protein
MATTTCAARSNAIVRYPGLKRYAGEMVVGNRAIPGVDSPDQLRDPAPPVPGRGPAEALALLHEGRQVRIS